MNRLKLATIDNENKNNETEKEVKKPKIKKPLNAFMLFMKEMRTKIVAEGSYKDSSSINKSLGKQWRLLSLEEQSKYYELAKIEKQQHKLLYPGWTARDNYAKHVKRRQKLFTPDGNLAISTGGVKKCRARFGLEQRDKWCKPCKTKKRCIKYVSSANSDLEGEGVDGEMSETESITIIDEPNAELDSEDDNTRTPITVEPDSEEEIIDDDDGTTVNIIIEENSSSP